MEHTTEKRKEFILANAIDRGQREYGIPTKSGKKEFRAKIVVAGDSQVGKTSFLLTLTTCVPIYD
jgi:GTPase SAR1 family protein